MAKIPPHDGDRKNSRLVEQKRQQELLQQTQQEIHQIILDHAIDSYQGNQRSLHFLTELASYLRSIFEVDFCLLCPPQQGNGILVTANDSSSCCRSPLISWLVASDLLTPRREMIVVNNCQHLPEIDRTSLPQPLRDMVSLLGMETPTSRNLTNNKDLTGNLAEDFTEDLTKNLTKNTTGDRSEDLTKGLTGNLDGKLLIISGGLVLLGCHQEQNWTKEQQELLHTLIPLVAIALHQSQIQHQLDICYPYQKLVNQITQAIRDHEEINQILQQAITAIGQTLGANTGTILLLKYKEPAWKRADRKSLEMITAHKTAQWSSPLSQFSHQVIHQVLSEFGNQSSNQASSQDHSQVNNLSHQDFPPLLPQKVSFSLALSPLCGQAFQQAPQPLTMATNPGGVIFPLMGAVGHTLPARVLGFLVLEYYPTRQLLEGELELISSVSNQISYALIQDQTLRQVKAIVDDRTAQLQTSLEVQGRLYEKIRHQVDQLRQLNQIKDEFISAISHELRTPLTSMSLAIRMLREETLSPAKQAKYLEVLEQQCQQEILLINDLLALQQLEENSPLISLETIDLQPLLQQLAKTFYRHWANKALTLELEIIPTPSSKVGNLKASNTKLGHSKAENSKSIKVIVNENTFDTSPLPSILVVTHADSLQRILAELLTNAGKYSDPKTTVRLRIEQAAGETIFRIANEGDGIAPEEQDLIFEKFHRTKTAVEKTIAGTGLGLALVKPLVKHLRGKISVSSKPQDDRPTWITCFTVKLPHLLVDDKV
jgi:signal transduction histidine kinase